ncbi:MAG TPA: cobalamin-dependent protein, partial [Methylomirabilota bacterium]|nr:cobalamin-dependent protein [Methylomirabilota bacterium]
MKALVAILGLDSHWRGAIAVVRTLRELGAETVYLGNQFPEEIAEAALQEAADLVCLSTLSGSHHELLPEIFQALERRGVRAPVLVGGAIPPQDVPALKALGVADVFGPGRPLDELARWVRIRD